jgi:hypothetical protein
MEKLGASLNNKMISALQRSCVGITDKDEKSSGHWPWSIQGTEEGHNG